MVLYRAAAWWHSPWERLDWKSVPGQPGLQRHLSLKQQNSQPNNPNNQVPYTLAPTGVFTFLNWCFLASFPVITPPQTYAYTALTSHNIFTPLCASTSKDSSQSFHPPSFFINLQPVRLIPLRFGSAKVLFGPQDAGGRAVTLPWRAQGGSLSPRCSSPGGSGTGALPQTHCDLGVRPLWWPRRHYSAAPLASTARVCRTRADARDR